MSAQDLQPGDMVTENGVEHMVLRTLPGNIVRIRRWPIAQAPLAKDVDVSTVVFKERPSLPIPKKNEGQAEVPCKGSNDPSEAEAGKSSASATGGGNE